MSWDWLIFRVKCVKSCSNAVVVATHLIYWHLHDIWPVIVQRVRNNYYFRDVWKLREKRMIFFITHIHWKEINWWNINLFKKSHQKLDEKYVPQGSLRSISQISPSLHLIHIQIWMWTRRYVPLIFHPPPHSVQFSVVALSTEQFVAKSCCSRSLLANRMRSSIFQHIIREWLGFLIGSMADEIDEERGTSPGNETQFPLPVCCLHNKTLPG